MELKSRLIAGALAVVATAGVAVAVAEPAQAFPAACVHMQSSSTASDGIPGSIYYKHMQCFAAESGYTGPIDGVPGANTWKAVQSRLATFGYYSGAIDGIPGTGTYSGLQRYAAKYSFPGKYTGPIDGVMGPNTYRALAAGWNYDYS